MARSREEARKFRELYNHKEPETGAAMNIVATYFFNEILNQEFVTEDDVRWCYNVVKKELGVNLEQSLRDSKRDQYLNGKKTPLGRGYSITACGINYFNSIKKDGK